MTGWKRSGNREKKLSKNAQNRIAWVKTGATYSKKEADEHYAYEKKVAQYKAGNIADSIKTDEHPEKSVRLKTIWK